MIDFVVNGVHLDFDNVIHSIDEYFDEAVKKRAKDIASKMSLEKYLSRNIMYELRDNLDSALMQVNDAIEKSYLPE